MEMTVIRAGYVAQIRTRALSTLSHEASMTSPINSSNAAI